MDDELFSVESCDFYAANWPIDFIPALRQEYKGLTISDCAILEYISKNLRFINVKNEGAQRPYKTSYRKLAGDFNASKDTVAASINFLIKEGLLEKVERTSYIINCKKINSALLKYKDEKSKTKQRKSVLEVRTKR
jgi:DNA-binding transcriptional regulator YhcF (GntR family)